MAPVLRVSSQYILWHSPQYPEGAPRVLLHVSYGGWAKVKLGLKHVGFSSIPFYNKACLAALYAFHKGEVGAVFSIDEPQPLWLKPAFHHGVEALRKAGGGIAQP